MRSGSEECWFSVRFMDVEGWQREDEKDVIVRRMRKRGMVERSVSRIR